jgi:putative MATE family efflux protein
LTGGAGSADGRIGALLRQSVPTTLVGFAQGGALIAETALVGSLGTEPLAAYALVLPFALLMGMMSTGAMGGGVSAAIARTLGAGRPDEAAALIRHALLIGGGLGLMFCLLVELGARPLFEAIGARGTVLDLAVLYAGVLFLGVPAHWIVATLASVLRGAGVMDMPARLIAIAWLVEPVLGAALMFGVGPLPALGIIGLPIAYGLVFTFTAVLLLRRVLAGACGFVPRLAGPLTGGLFMRILSVGAVASAMATLSVLTTVAVTALVAGFGPAAIAAYGIAARLEFLMVPLSFGIGATLTQQVGRRVGAGQWALALGLAWRGAWLVCVACAAIGFAVALFPDPWIALFTRDPEVADIARLALRIIGPAYALLGLGMALYFASQGAGRMRWPFAAAIARLACAGGGGALACGPLGLGLAGVFGAVAAGLACYGLLVAVGVRARGWQARG